MRKTFQHSKPMFFSCVHYFSVAVNSRYINPPSGQSNLQVDNTLLQRRQGHDNFFLQSQYVSSVCVYLTKATYFRQAVIYFSGAKRTTVEVYPLVADSKYLCAVRADI